MDQGHAAVMPAASPSVGAPTRGIRLPHYDKLRDVMDEQLDAVWSGQKPPKQGLDDAVRLGDIAMKAPSATQSKDTKKPIARKKKASKS